MFCKVSVIVPVYNAEKYLEECLLSIVNQTFHDIEILLIVQNGKDRSLEISNEWVSRDERIRVIVKTEKERGLGKARNTGIHEAKGKYVTFLDADDTWDSSFLEKMYNAIEKEGADIAECDLYKIKIDTGKKEYVPCTYIMNRNFNTEDKLLLGNVSVMKLMIRKEFLTDNHIEHPDLYSPDIAVYALAMCSTDKVVEVKEGLYYYKKFGGTKTMYTDVGAVNQRVLAFEWLIEECHKRKLFPKWEKEIKQYIRRWISRYWSVMLLIVDEEMYLKSKKAYENCFLREFGGELKREVEFGSYNLSKIINKLDLIEDPYSRINFSSIISVMSDYAENVNINHKNEYRQLMLEREKEKKIFLIVEEKRPQYFFFDLIEERHDIVEIEGSYFTQSDAWVEMENIPKHDRVIYRKSEECTDLWRKSCDLFLTKLFEYLSPSHVYMIENYLCETYSDGTEEQYFENIEEIRNTNLILKKYYDYIRVNYPQINVIEAYKVNNYCTDQKYEFGCYPWHINEWANIEIAKCIDLT